MAMGWDPLGSLGRAIKRLGPKGTKKVVRKAGKPEIKPGATRKEKTSA